MNVPNHPGEGRTIRQPKQALAVRKFELIDVHDPIAACHLVKAERVVQMLVSDPLVDQRTRRVLEPALPASVRRDDPHVGNQLESVEGNGDSQRQEPVTKARRFVESRRSLIRATAKRPGSRSSPLDREPVYCLEFLIETRGQPGVCPS
jgi:hypothetical protein